MTKHFMKRWSHIVGVIRLSSVLGLLCLGGCSLVSEVQSKMTDVQAKVTHSMPPVESASKVDQVALAQHLQSSRAVMYGAYWCPYCHAQKELFGAEAAQTVPYVECDERGQNAEPQRCEEADIKSYPTWELNGEL
jgi:thiol-disulfide isomerase/thioredoxin